LNAQQIMRTATASQWASTIFTLIIFGGFGLCFAGFGVYAMVQSYPKQGWVAVGGGSIFILFGLGLAALVVFASIAHSRDLKRQAADPDHPWRWNTQWNSRDSTDHPYGGAIGAWLIAVIWNGIPAAALSSMLLGRQKTPPLAVIIVLLFLSVGLYLIFASLQATRRAMRYGQSVLHLSTLPGEIGGHLTGEIRLGRPIDATGPARLRLACKRTSTGEHSATTTSWQDVREVQLPDSRTGTTIPLDFEIPANLPPTRSGTSTLDRITWTLEATVAARDVDYRSKFDVPVFDVHGVGTSATSDFPSFAPPESNIGRIDHSGEPPSHPGIVLTRLASGGSSFHFAAGRNWGAAVCWTLIGAGLTWGLLYAQQVHGDVILRIWLAIFVIPFDYAALDGWLASSSVTARASGLHIDRGWPLWRSRADLPASAIKDIADQISTTAGNTSYYRLIAKPKSGVDVTLASGIRDHAVAKWVAVELLRSIGKAGELSVHQ
jgi:hypothetical protein